MEENYKSSLDLENYNLERSTSVDYCESYNETDQKTVFNAAKLDLEVKNTKDSALRETAQLFFFAPTADFQESILENAFSNEGFDAISNVSKINCNLAKMQASSFDKAIDIISSFYDKQMSVKQQQPPQLTLSSSESIKFCELLLNDINLKQISYHKSAKRDYPPNKLTRSNFLNNNNGINLNKRPVEIIIEKIPCEVDINDLLSVFSRCGRVEGIKTYPRSSDYTQNCASLTYSNMSMAQKAIRYFDGKFRMNESTKPLSVRIVNNSK